MKSQEDMYRFVANFLAEAAPGRLLSSVMVLEGDGFFDQEMIVNLGFTNARFVMDHFHLYISPNPGLAKMFGKRGFELLKGHLIQMIQANSEEEFDSIVESARQKLHAQTPRDQQMESDLNTFAGKWESYAQYCLDKIPGNRGLRSSSVSKQNNSSAVKYLNDGKKSGNNYMNDPAHMVAKLLGR